MLTQILKPEWNDEYNNYDYDNYKVLATYTIEEFDKFVRFIQALIDKDLCIGEDWYTIDSYVFSFPRNNEYIPCFKIYVAEKY